MGVSTIQEAIVDIKSGKMVILVDDEDRVSRPSVPVLAHQVDLRVLEADDFSGLQFDPAREKSRAMSAILIEVIGDADAGPVGSFHETL